MKVCLICDDCYHPAHIPIAGLTELCARGIKTDICTDTTALSAEKLKNYPVVILAKGNKRSFTDQAPWEDGEASEALISYVQGGGGLLLIHAGAAVKVGADALHDLIGCRFKFHPEQCEVYVQPLKPHPITRGIDAFTEMDEHYFMEILAPDADILFTSVSSHGVSVAGFTRIYGAGRVCVLTPGHNLTVWKNPAYAKAIYNAISWCGGERCKL